MKNRPSCVGFIHQPLGLQQKDSLPVARTNLSQACKSFESANNIFGRCKNPWNMKRTPGGSSGGESGMLAGGCSVFGLASDIGGSARIPSSFCGLYTLMSHRNSKKSTSYFGKFASGVGYIG
jgi:Asp-tRNA(Asn)/Glu-tRNA(Gln) amidotransferase A subunit family amidase